MNYTERKQAICEKCGQQEVCGFYFTDERQECAYLQNVMEGWKLGQQDALVAVEDYVDRGELRVHGRVYERIKTKIGGLNYDMYCVEGAKGGSETEESVYQRE